MLSQSAPSNSQNSGRRLAPATFLAGLALTAQEQGRGFAGMLVEDEYEVERIVDRRNLVGIGLQYLVKWKGVSSNRAPPGLLHPRSLTPPRPPPHLSGPSLITRGSQTATWMVARSSSMRGR